jgi:lysyl-tRNA synthetase class 2
VTRAEALRRRARVLRALRRHLDDRGFVEIEAPIAVASPGLEPHLDAFELRTDGPRRYLHTSPEYALKRLLGAGLTDVYSLGPCFRDEPPSRTHSPEFTMLEWYATGLDLAGLMAQTEDVVCAAAAAVDVALPRPFARQTVRAAFVEHAGVDAWALDSADALRDAARAAGVRVPTESPAWDDVFFSVFLDAVEPRLAEGPPTFLWGWPASQAALARLDPADPTTALRFELYAGGFELANAFDELTDPVEQRTRFEADQALRAELGGAVYPIDEALLAALPGIPPTAGIALGVDRLVMWLLGADDIAAVRAQPW